MWVCTQVFCYLCVFLLKGVLLLTCVCYLGACVGTWVLYTWEFCLLRCLFDVSVCLLRFLFTYVFVCTQVFVLHRCVISS